MSRETPTPRPVTLELDTRLHPTRESYRNLSAVAESDGDLWVASDELTSVERLSRVAEDQFGEHRTFRLREYLDLPAGDEEEVDIEGLAVDRGYLWVTGSHSLKRESPSKAKGRRDAIRRLAHMVRDTNRFLLARIPLVRDGRTGRLSLGRTARDRERRGQPVAAAQLSGTGSTNLLVDALQHDPHLGRFVAIPSKENGLDVEGLAADGDRVFLGLRGPVLAGWAVILELEVAAAATNRLTLKPIGPGGTLYRKHFVDLRGLGVRELCRDGKDLLILAGPTMDLDGHVRVLRWKNALKATKEKVVRRKRLETVLEFRFGRRAKPGKDHAEGISIHQDQSGTRGLLVTYDSPSGRKRLGNGRMVADLFPLDL